MIAAESLAGPWFECPRPVGLGTAELLPPLLKVSAMAVSFAAGQDQSNTRDITKY
jgi:hypothetical protein